MALIRRQSEEELHFEPEYVPEVREEYGKKYLMLFMVLILFIIVGYGVSILTKEKKMRLIEVVVPKKGTIITKKVSYSTSEKTDPDDTSDIFFEVINDKSDDRFVKGDLVKFNHRHVEEQTIEGVLYNLLDGDSVQFTIKAKDVKADLLKR